MRGTWCNNLKQLLRGVAVAVGAVSTAAVGLGGASEEGAGLAKAMGADNDRVLLPNTLNSTAEDRYAAHRSHSSHGSHRSHRSSSGGGYRPSRPVPTPQPRDTSPPSRSAPSVPSRAPQTGTPLKPSIEETSMMVLRVQAALMRRGYYDGNLDGILGPKTRSAIKKFQESQGISQTGRMDIGTLTRLGISIP